MLISLKAPTPKLDDGCRAEGMLLGSTAVEPGTPPPWLVPHCHKCGVPVESFTPDWVASPFYLPIQFQCHGVTSGIKLSYIDVLKASKSGGMLWVFTETKVSHVRRNVR